MGTESTSPVAAKAKPEVFELSGLPKMSRAFHLGTWLCLLLAVMGAYSRALWLSAQAKRADEPSPKYFALDNKFIILEDPRLRVNFRGVDRDGNKTWPRELKNNLKLIWNQDYWWPKAVSGLYRPTTNTTYMLNFSFINDAGMPPTAQSAAPYILVNMFLHFLNCVLVFYLVALLVQRAWPAVLAAVMWAVHPVCVETVANIVGRADEFSCFFAITGFLAYYKMTRAQTTQSRLWWLLLCGLLFIVGLTAKENTVVLVFMVLTFDFIFRPEQRSALTKADWIFAAVWAAFFMFLLLYIIQRWDMASPSSPAVALGAPELRESAAWANAFKYAARIGLGLTALAALAGIGIATFWLLDRVFPIHRPAPVEGEAPSQPGLSGTKAWLGRVYVVVALVVSFFGIWPLVDKWFGKHAGEKRLPYWKWFLARVPAYLVLATPVLFWFSIRARLFAGMREPELPFVDNPLVWFWEDGLGGHSVLSFITNGIQSLSAPVPIHLHDGRQIYWSFGWALSQMIPAWLTAIKVIVGNLMLIVFPTTLSPDYSYNQIPLVNFNSEQWKQLIFPTNDPPGMADVTPLLQQWGGLRLVEPVNMLLANGLAFLALAVVILLFVIAIIAYFRFKPTSFFLLLVFLAMLPTTNLLFVMGSIQAERFLYIPTMGFCVLIVLTVYGVVRKLTGGLNPHALAHNPQAVVSQPQADVPRALTGHHKPARVKAARFILIGICVLFAGRAWFRSAVWESDVTLWESAVTVCPNSFKTHKSLAYAWYEKSQNNLELLRKPQKRWGQERAEIDWIIDHARQAIWVTRESQIVFVHLGAYLRIKGDAIQMENAKFAGLPPEQRPANLDDPRPYYFNSAAVLAAAKPLDSDFNQRHRRYERGRGKTDDQIADIGNYEIYWNLGIAQMRLAALDQQRLAAIAQKEGAEQERQQLIAQITNELRAAIDGFWYMRHLAPGNIDAHLNMAMAYWQFGDLENAAVCFLSALLLDNNRQDALEALSRVYSQVPNQDPDPMRRPVVPAGVGLRLNIDSPLVRNHLQKAYVQLYQLFLDIRERNFARQIRDAALTQYKFPPEAFVALPPPPPVADPPKVPVQVAVFLVSALALVAALGFGWWGTTKSSAHQLPPV